MRRILGGIGFFVWSLLKAPSVMLPVIGITGFAADYFYKPITLVGLALLAFAATPWLLMILKRIKIAGIEVELLPQTKDERRQRIKKELQESSDKGSEPAVSANGITEAPAGAASYISKTQRGEVSAQTEVKEVDSYRETEKKVFRWLERAYKGSVRPEVKFGPFFIDAIIDTKFERVLVEVKIVSSRGSSRRILENGLRQIKNARDFYALTSEGRGVRALLIVAYDDDDKELTVDLHELREELNRAYRHASVRMVPISELSDS